MSGGTFSRDAAEMASTRLWPAACASWRSSAGANSATPGTSILFSTTTYKQKGISEIMLAGEAAPAPTPPPQARPSYSAPPPKKKRGYTRSSHIMQAGDTAPTPAPTPQLRERPLSLSTTTYAKKRIPKRRNF